MNKFTAFLQGVIEFKNSCTFHYEDYGLLLAYEKGRDFAHFITLRKYEA